MRDINYVSLSKAMSKALRHRPERIGIELAPDGSVELVTLIDALNSRGGWPRTIVEADILHVVEHGSKERFAVEDGRIRARYGHSIPSLIAREAAQPPAMLYHGTSTHAAERIATEGLLPMGRQFVHLSTDVPTAIQVGRRHGDGVVVLDINSARAFTDGVDFYQGNDSTWLCDYISPKYISFEAHQCQRHHSSH